MHIEKGRIGQFFLFVAIVLFIFLLGMNQFGSAQLGLMCLSMCFFILAIVLIWRDWKPRAGSERFRSLRKMTQKKQGGKK
jgi:Ca2+/Na+ antiporter